MRLSLILPCFNEAANLPSIIDRCRALLVDEAVEVILVDNGSTDETAALLPSLIADLDRLRSVRVPVNRGYGHGILRGLDEADGDIVGWTHADQQTDPVDAAAGLAMFRGSSDPQNLFVKGRRHGRSLSDMVFTAGMSVFETIIAGRILRDVNAQPTLMHRVFKETWKVPPEDFGLDLYAYWRASAAGLQVTRIPVRFGPRAYGKSHWNTGLMARWKFIRRTIQFSLELRRSAN